MNSQKELNFCDAKYKSYYLIKIYTVSKFSNALGTVSK